MLHDGLYEQIINKGLETELATADKLSTTAPIDGAEASKVLAKYIAEVVEKGLDNVADNGGDVSSQVALANRIISTIIHETKENELDVEMGKGGLPVIYAIKPTETSNNNCCVWLKNAFASRKIRLLIDESEKRTDYTKDKKFFTDPEYSALQIAPFIQTSQFVFETLNLVYEVRDKGNIAVREQGRNRKDRYSSLSYANYLAELIENEKYKKGKKRKSKFMFFYN